MNILPTCLVQRSGCKSLVQQQVPMAMNFYSAAYHINLAVFVKFKHSRNHMLGKLPDSSASL